MFEGVDAVALARAQFAFTMSFHIIFPAFSIGLASYLAVLEARWLLTGREVFINLFNYWLKIFAVAFGMGVVSGHRDGLPIRHQLVGLCRQDRPRDRPVDGL
jgi:cytochrome bd ubiquinol oxidase subunit I